ncbi:MAG: hypothetical protein ACJAZX_000023 [Rickettsiales bacterium]|jgi:hypothetical protein
MSKFSKNLRKTKIVSYIIERKRIFFRKFRLYSFIRHLYLEQKWYLKFKFFSNYRKVNNYLSKNYHNIKVNRPEDGFSDFDIGVTAQERENNKKVYIQIVLRKKELSDGGGFNRKVNSFFLKNKYYNIFHEEAFKRNPKIGKHAIKTIEFNLENKDFAFLVSEYRNFIPMKYFIEGKEFQQQKVKNSLIDQVNFYSEVFNEIKLPWGDVIMHNMMIVKGDNGFILVPMDFVDREEEDIIKIKQHNKSVVQTISEYIRG